MDYYFASSPHLAERDAQLGHTPTTRQKGVACWMVSGMVLLLLCNIRIPSPASRDRCSAETSTPLAGGRAAAQMLYTSSHFHCYVRWLPRGFIIGQSRGDVTPVINIRITRTTKRQKHKRDDPQKKKYIESETSTANMITNRKLYSYGKKLNIYKDTFLLND